MTIHYKPDGISTPDLEILALDDTQKLMEKVRTEAKHPRTGLHLVWSDFLSDSSRYIA